MNLQVCIPYIPCPFHCPMCIASGRKRYEDLYKTNEEEYFKALEKNFYKYKTFVLTGDTDPTLNRHWLKDILNFCKTHANPNQEFEIQTHNYNLQSYDLDGLTTICYSIVSLKDYLKIKNFKKLEKGNNRLVILLTKDFEFLNLETFDPSGFNQVTFKILQESADAKVNKYIEENRLTDLTEIYKIVNKYNGNKEVSVRLDTNCQDSDGRYEIFRSDGHYYHDWMTETPSE